MRPEAANSVRSRIRQLLYCCAAFPGITQLAEANSPLEIRGGVVFSISAPKLFGPWISQVPSRMPGTGWNRLLTLGYAPFLSLTNTSDRALAIRGNPTVGFSQPDIGFKFTRVGDLLPGNITTGRIQVDQMYVHSDDRGGKIFQFTLYETVTADGASGSIRLASGQTKILSPVIAANQSFDYQNNQTQNMQGVPGWFGHHNAYWIDWLTAGSLNLVAGQNGGLGVIPTRDSDLWDVESAFTGAAAGWRVFGLRPDRTPVLHPDSGLEITEMPFRISDHRGMIATADMQMPAVATLAAPGVQPLFCMIGPPIATVPSTRVTDNGPNSLDDDWELQHFRVIGVDPEGDEDGDGHGNRFEYLSGHSPVDSADRFSHSFSLQDDGRLRFTWSSSPGLLYGIDYSADLKGWSQVATEAGAAAPAGSTTSVLDLPGDRAGFYRIRLSEIR